MNLRARLYDPVARFLPESIIERRWAHLAEADFCAAGVVFIHIPRTAGVSVIRAIYQSDCPRHFAVEQFLKIASSKLLHLPRFTIVRNPWGRALSAYQFAKQGGVPGGAQMAHPERYRVAAFATFDTFVEQYLATHDVCKLDGVFRPQSCYLGSNAEETLDHIGVFSRLGETESWLSETLGHPVKLPHSNATDRKQYASLYSDRTRRIVGEIYRADIERFAFKF